MAEIGYCYGSEYHTLRFLGHHRNDLENEIKKQTTITGDFKWLDFQYDNTRLSLDGEYKEIEFLENLPNYNEIKKKWIDYWPQSGSAQNWDAIFKVGNTYVLIEAKAHLEEMKQFCGATSAESRSKIAHAFNQTRKYFSIESETDWFNNYYQLANRLSFVYFMNLCGINAILLYVYFLNGYEIREKRDKSILGSKSVKSIDEWENAILKEHEYLGILHTNAKKCIHSLYIDCMPVYVASTRINRKLEK